MMSPAVLLRATKKAGVLPRRSSSGWTNAKAHNAPRWAPPIRSSRRRSPFRLSRIRLNSPGSGMREVERAQTGGKLDAALDLEALLQRPLEAGLLVVGVRSFALARE